MKQTAKKGGFDDETAVVHIVPGLLRAAAAVIYQCITMHHEDFVFPPPRRSCVPVHRTSGGAAPYNTNVVPSLPAFCPTEVS